MKSKPPKPEGVFLEKLTFNHLIIKRCNGMELSRAGYACLL